MIIFTVLLLFLSACEKESGPLNPAGKIRTTKVDPPRSVRIEKGKENSVDIRWSAPASDAGFSGRYNVQFKRRSNAIYNFSYETEERTYNVHVIRDTTYDYRVRSLAAAGWEPSDWVTTEYTLTHEVAVENSTSEAVENSASESKEDDEAPADEADATAAVSIPDEALRQYLERVLKKNRGATITHADMRTIVNLLEGHTTFQDTGGSFLLIESLVGLEAATNLQNVALGWGRISDVSPLAHLSKLRYLGLRGNQISDVSPLANLPKLRYLDLRGNPFLNDVSINEHVPALQRRGVEVVLSPYHRTFPDSPFDIELVFLDDFTEVEQEIMHQAARRWEAAIQEDIPDLTYHRSYTGSCNDRTITIPAGEQVDDIRIYLTRGDLGLLGAVGIFNYSISEDLPSPYVDFRSSCVIIDHLEGFKSLGMLWSVGLHEIGHALGIGTSGDWKRRVRDLDWQVSDPSTADPHFVGPQAIAAFDQAGGANHQGAKVPTDEYGKHWRSDVLSGELMAPSPRNDILSAITLGALSDLGYTVDFSAADPYELPPPGAAKPVADAISFCLVEMKMMPPPVYVDD